MKVWRMKRELLDRAQSQEREGGACVAGLLVAFLQHTRHPGGVPSSSSERNLLTAQLPTCLMRVDMGEEGPGVHLGG